MYINMRFNNLTKTIETMNILKQNNLTEKAKIMNNSKANADQVGRYNQLAYYSFVMVMCLLVSVTNAYAVYDLADVKTELIDKGWGFIDTATPFIAVGGGLLGAFFARNMDWGMRAAGFGTGTIGFGLALQGVKAYYGL